MVLSLPFSAGSRAIQEVIKRVSRKKKDKTLYLLGATDDGKVLHGCCVSPEAQGKAADAAKWPNEVAELDSGKACGKRATSLGQGTSADKVDDAVEVARKYFEGLKL